MQPAPASAVNARTDDAELVRRIAGGDHAACRELMRRHNQRLYRTARAILKDDAEAEDSVQEAYLLAFRAMGNFRGDAKLSTWLTRIVANEALGRLRKRTRAAEVIPFDTQYGETGEIADAMEDDMNSQTPEQPETAAVRGETRRLLEAKIDDLPDGFRAVFMLRAIEDLTVEETAVALDIPEATVRTRFFRARGMLREALSREIDLAHADAFSFLGERCDRIVANVMARLEAPPPASG
jgi:RNA polymerase sigma-70 factor (ECF subfamily)